MVVGSAEDLMSIKDAYRHGMAAYNAEDYAGAIERLTPVAAENESRAVHLLGRFYCGQAHYQLALQMFKQTRFQEAAAHFEAAARLNPAGGSVERFLAACYLKTGRYELASPQFQQVLRQSPDDHGARIRLALLQWKQGFARQAMSTLTDGLSRHPTDAELGYQMGVLLAAQDQVGAAAECFEQVIQHDPHHAGAYERLAQCHAVLGRHERVQACLEKAIELDPDNKLLRLQLNVLRQDFGTAPKPATAARATHPQRVFDQSAIEKLGELVACEPEFIEAFLSLPASEVDQEVFSALAATLEYALAGHPQFADLHYHCGAVYRRLGRSSKAIQHAERAVQLNPRYVNALILLARLYAQTERYTDGVERIEQAIQAGGDYADAHYLLGRLLIKTGHATRARDAFRRALALNQNFRAARQALDSLATANA